MDFGWHGSSSKNGGAEATTQGSIAFEHKSEHKQDTGTKGEIAQHIPKIKKLGI